MIAKVDAIVWRKKKELAPCLMYLTQGLSKYKPKFTYF